MLHNAQAFRTGSRRAVTEALYWLGGGNSVRVPLGPLRGRRLALPDRYHPALALGTYERHVLRALAAHTAPGAVAYDIGAHVGYITLALSRFVGPQGSVVAFEPDPRNRALLRKNLRCNGAMNVRVVDAAVSDCMTGVEFATQMVRSATLDSFVYTDGNQPPSVLKIDVEGAEARVIAGAARVVREARPVIVAEIRHGETAAAVQTMLAQAGYEGRPLGGAFSTWMSDMPFLPR